MTDGESGRGVRMTTWAPAAARYCKTDKPTPEKPVRATPNRERTHPVRSSGSPLASLPLLVATALLLGVRMTTWAPAAARYCKTDKPTPEKPPYILR
jgi:hypothetical protein